MRLFVLAFLALLASRADGQAVPIAAGPTDPRAQKAFAEAQDLERHHRWLFALDGYRKADKLDGNHCAACDEKAVDLAAGIHDWKAADGASAELVSLAQTPSAQAAAHLRRAKLFLAMGRDKHKQQCFAEAQHEAELALASVPADRAALFLKAEALAEQQQDAAAKEIFAALLARLQPNTVDRERVARSAERPELVRARMAPPFSVQTLDGKRVSLDSLQDKVVLLDFWATWCGPCREALPHMQHIAREFAGQPLVILSISLDNDENKWKDFIAKNNMDWLHARDGSFTGPVAQLFQVNSIPHTFTIDADGVLQDEHIGDGSIAGKLRKLIAQARLREQSRPQISIADK